MRSSPQKRHWGKSDEIIASTVIRGAAGHLSIAPNGVWSHGKALTFSAMRPMEEGNLEMSVMWPCADYFSYASAWKVKIDEKATATKLARTRNARTRLHRFKGNKPLVLMKPRPRSDIWPGSATHS